MLQDDGLMIVCDICSLWQHAVCFCILDEEHAPEEHVCDACAKVGHQSNRRKKLLLIAGMQVFQHWLVFWQTTLELWAVSNVDIFCWIFSGMLKLFLCVLLCWFLYQSNIVHIWVPTLLSLRLSGGHKFQVGLVMSVCLCSCKCDQRGASFPLMASPCSPIVFCKMYLHPYVHLCVCVCACARAWLRACTCMLAH